jgi:hypothetical protein
LGEPLGQGTSASGSKTEYNENARLHARKVWDPR